MHKKFKSEFHVFRWFLDLNVEQVLRSVLGRNNSLEPPVFGFSNSLSYGLEE